MARTRYTHLKDGFMYTFSGTAFCLYDPQPEQVCIADIAHGLSKNVRFNGQIVEDYMIAEHSLLMSYLNKGEEFHALNHDDAEGYIGDLIRPLKYLEDMSPYREIEHAIEAVISEKYKFPTEKTPNMARYDRFMAGAEAVKFFMKPPEWAIKRLVEMNDLTRPTLETILWPGEAELLWLRRYQELTGMGCYEIIEEAVTVNKGVIGRKAFHDYYQKLETKFDQMNLIDYKAIQFGEKDGAARQTSNKDSSTQGS
jgi:uncharacterized protein